MATNSVAYFAAEATGKILHLYPKTICSTFTILDHFGIIWLGVAIAALVVFRALREYRPSMYLSMDHDKLTRMLNLGRVFDVAAKLYFKTNTLQKGSGLS